MQGPPAIQRTSRAAGAEWAFRALLLALLLFYAAWLAGDLYSQVAFPWDILTCFETSFLSGMLKLHNGLGLYSAPQLANSEVYPPGIHYLTYALLRPLGADLDIRACRAVAVLLTLFTTLIGGVLLLRLLRELRDGRRSGAWLAAYVFLAAFLLLHKNMTSDQPHPDNLHLLHAAVALLLTWEALRRVRHATNPPPTPPVSRGDGQAPLSAKRRDAMRGRKV
jgi:hypothetical protein